jgi:hypothetical protein
MGKLTGLLMIVAGVGTAAYVYPHLVTGADQAEKQLTDIVAIATPGATQVQRPQLPPTRIISADVKPSVATAPSAPASSSAATAKATAVVPPAALPPTVPPSITAPAVVAIAPQPLLASRPIEPPVPQPAKRSKADEDRTQLSREIQRELRRVGCLQSEPDGNWNSSTRAAMKTFVERVNATLPTDEPDHILKTLVQGHPGNACAKSCPAGQSAAVDGRCMPTGVVAQAPLPAPAPTLAKRSERTAEQAAASVKETPKASDAIKASEAPSAAAKRPAETASLPVPKVAVSAAKEPAAAATSSWQTTVSPPAMAAIAAAAVAGTVDARSNEPPLPGRMSVGAAAPVVEPQPPVTTFRPTGDAPKIVVKPRVGPRDDGAENPDRKPEARPESRPERADSNRPSIGAVSASDGSRRSSSPSASRVAAYRAPPPPPRYVGAYVPAPSYRPNPGRPRFGPQIFRQLEASGR